MDPAAFNQPPLSFRPVQFLTHGAQAFWEFATEDLARLKAMGFGGVMTRVHLEDYLTNEAHWLRLREELDELRRLGMTAWIRDDSGRPSGKAAGRAVARYPEGEARGLLHLDLAVEGGRSVAWPVPAGRLVYAAALPWQGDHVTL